MYTASVAFWDVLRTWGCLADLFCVKSLQRDPTALTAARAIPIPAPKPAQGWEEEEKEEEEWEEEEEEKEEADVFESIPKPGTVEASTSAAGCDAGCTNRFVQGDPPPRRAESTPGQINLKLDVKR